jgi:hypothetical protein
VLFFFSPAAIRDALVLGNLLSFLCATRGRSVSQFSQYRISHHRRHISVIRIIIPGSCPGVVVAAKTSQPLLHVRAPQRRQLHSASVGKTVSFWASKQKLLLLLFMQEGQGRAGHTLQRLQLARQHQGIALRRY